MAATPPSSFHPWPPQRLPPPSFSLNLLHRTAPLLESRTAFGRGVRLHLARHLGSYNDHCQTEEDRGTRWAGSDDRSFFSCLLP
ncbi:hypothetical protein SESBI_49742 [Sesbania bispinosa]|nr:hypothetical protein SESBI_49742 [Sesbania bispinosa]